VHSDTQHHLGAVLIDYELIQVLSQCFRRDMIVPHVAGAAKRTSCRLVSFIERREALAAEVGAVIRRQYGAPCGEGAAATDAVEGKVRCSSLRRDGWYEGASDYHGEYIDLGRDRSSHCGSLRPVTSVRSLDVEAGATSGEPEALRIESRRDICGASGQVRGRAGLISTSHSTHHSARLVSRHTG
jgi:hypothetical protein